MKARNLSALKFGTQIDGVRAHLGNHIWLEYSKHSQSYLQLFVEIIPICCQVLRVNRAWHEAENCYRSGLTVEPQTLKEIKLKIMKI